MKFVFNPRVSSIMNTDSKSTNFKHEYLYAASAPELQQLIVVMQEQEYELVTIIHDNDGET